MKTLNKAFFKNREVVEFKEQVFEILKLDIAQSIHAERDPNTYKYRIKERTFADGRKYKSVGSVFVDYYRKLKPEEREIMGRKIESKFDETTFTTTRSRIGSFNLKSDKSVLDQITSSDILSKIRVSEFPLKDLLLSSGPSASVSSGSANVTATVKKTIKEIDFILNEVKCVDETNPEPLGKDEISMGGNAIDDKGTTTKISEFNVGNFNDGDIKKYSEGKYLKKFFPDSDYTENKLFVLQLFLIEKDSEGSSEFLSDAYEATKNYINALIVGAGATALATALATAIPSMGVSVALGIAAIAAALAVLILADLIKLIADALKDDIFTPSDEHLDALIVESSTDTFEDGSKEKTKYMTFEDHGGKYRVKYTWELVKS